MTRRRPVARAGADLRAVRKLRDPDIRALVLVLIDCGWTVKALGSGHVRVTHPGGQSVTAPASPSDHRAWANLRGSVRRIERAAAELEDGGDR